ncbi:MAG: family metallopeptidase [Rhodoglobus sp.]|nr:family metallopeptidase [Rhodoglobus sp.]
MTRREARDLVTPATARKALARSAKAAKAAAAARRRRNRGSAFVSLGALLAVGGLVVAVSVPANLFASDASSATLTTIVGQVKPTQSAQAMAIDDNVTVDIPVRDSFGTTSYAEQLRLQYANYGGSFSATTGAIRWPFPYTVPITDGFGLRAANISGQAMHNGVDFTPGAGSPIYAIADGVVAVHLEDTGGFGNHVIIQHSIPGQNVESLYGHMQYGSSPLNVGDAIKVGDFIGLVGDTGNSYGAHLHLEIHIDKVPVDPFAWLQANAVN